MRKTYRVLAYVLAGEVVVQSMAIAFALAGLGRWIEHDHGTLNKQVFDAHPTFTGSVGFPIHAINGEMLIPLIVLSLLVVSFFAKVAGGTRRAAILLGLVVLQVLLGVFAEDVPYTILLHALNAFGIFSMALYAGFYSRDVVPAPIAA